MIKWSQSIGNPKKLFVKNIGWNLIIQWSILDQKQEYEYVFFVLILTILIWFQGSNLDGVLKYAIATRPISDLLIKIEKKDKELESLEGNSRKVVVVGSGAAGLELAWAFR